MYFCLFLVYRFFPLEYVLRMLLNIGFQTENIYWSQPKDDQKFIQRLCHESVF